MLKITGLLGIALCALIGAPVFGQAGAGLVEAARAAVKDAWEQEIQPFRESALGAIKIHAVERRNRLAPGVHLIHAFAETSWWKHSQHYLLLMRSSSTGVEILYRFDGGSGGKGITYRLVDLGSAKTMSLRGRFALQISDHGLEDQETDGDTSGTWTVLVLHLPESDRFVEVFRELTSYRPPAAHGYDSELGFRQADGPLKDIAVSTRLLQDGSLIETVESIFTWQDSAYQGIMPLPDAWRAELPARIRQQAPVSETPTPEAPDPSAQPQENPP